MTATAMMTRTRTHLRSEKRVEKKDAPGRPRLGGGFFCEERRRQYGVDTTRGVSERAWSSPSWMQEGGRRLRGERGKSESVDERASDSRGSCTHCSTL